MAEHEHEFTVLTGHENDEPEVIACTDTDCGRQWTVMPRVWVDDSSAGGAALPSCCGSDIYWCPRAAKFECPIHGGFNTCCDQPERHTPLTRFETQANALLKWWRENREPHLAIQGPDRGQHEFAHPDIDHTSTDEFWHCRCGSRYPRHRRTCPTCGLERVCSSCPYEPSAVGAP